MRKIFLQFSKFEKSQGFTSEIKSSRIFSILKYSRNEVLAKFNFLCVLSIFLSKATMSEKLFCVSNYFLWFRNIKKAFSTNQLLSFINF